MLVLVHAFRAIFKSGAAVLLASAVLSSHALAQQVLQALNVDMQPLVYADDKGTHGCGVRVLLQYPSRDRKVFSETADFSVNFYALGAGMIKAGIVMVTNPSLPSSKWPRVVPADFTLMSEDGAVVPKVLRKQKSSEGPFLMIGLSLEDALATHVALTTGQRMQIRLTLPGDNDYRMISFVAQFGSKDDEASMESCFQAMMARLKRQLK